MLGKERVHFTRIGLLHHLDRQVFEIFRILALRIEVLILLEGVGRGTEEMEAHEIGAPRGTRICRDLWQR